MYEFFKQLYEIADIKQAFKQVLVEKLKFERYCNLTFYINQKMTKPDILELLVKENSRYAAIYNVSYPEQSDALSVWHENIREDLKSDIHLSNFEAKAIVYWIYRISGNKKTEREDFTKQIPNLIGFKDEEEIRYENGLLFYDDQIDFRLISSIEDINSFIKSGSFDNDVLFYRGHADMNFLLLPNILRSAELEKNEDKLFNEIIINCPEEFIECKTHLEKLVKMQHYGLPTRLLDITRNPLVALYFACESLPETDGELIVITASSENIKYPQSDTVSILTSLSALSYKRKEELRDLQEDSSFEDPDFKNDADPLLQEIRFDKPAFLPEFTKRDIFSSCIVQPIKNNKRIINQDGAFILCGLTEEKDALKDYRVKNDNKNVVLIIDHNSKGEILDELENYSINKAFLFPEIDSVAGYLTKKYS